MDFDVRFAQATDENKIFTLYQNVATSVGGIAREKDEITQNYVANNLKKSLENGACFVIENHNTMIAEIHCYQLEPRVFRHILSELTIVIHPDFQKKGFGKIIFETLLNHIEENRTDILRVELIARESNKHAIEFYQKIGFIIEGRFEQRISNPNGTFEADIPMAWFNKKYIKNSYNPKK